jgi:hypothetical protein
MFSSESKNKKKNTGLCKKRLRRTQLRPMDEGVEFHPLVVDPCWIRLRKHESLLHLAGGFFVEQTIFLA